MDLCPGNRYTTTVLKDVLRERGLSTYGTKAELMKRLEDFDSNIWKELSASEDDIVRVVDVSRSEFASRIALEDEVVEAEAGAVAPAGPGETTTGRTKQRDDEAQRERELLRRERELLERENALLRRELEMLQVPSAATRVTRVAPSSETTPAPGIASGIKELLPEFEGTDNTFWRWRQQLRLIKHSYHLDDDATRILIKSRLKGRALAWFYSKPEYLVVSIDELLQEMGQMFDHRPGKLILRKELEARTWKGDETFCDYYHEKVILANRVPIAEDEIVDYIIKGIMDRQLQNQARMFNFKTGEELVRAFENVCLTNAKQQSTVTTKESTKAGSRSGETETPLTRGRPVRCFKCRETGHVALHCQRGPTERACYVCGSMEHMARECPRRHQSTVTEVSRGPVQTTSTCVQLIELPKPDFINCPQVCVTMGETVKIAAVGETRAISELMNIDCRKGPVRSKEEFRINPAVGEDQSARISETNDSFYLRNF